MILSELRAQGWKYGCIAALFALLAATGTAGVQTYRVAVSKGAAAILARDLALATATAAEAMTRASEAARAEERSRAQAVDAVARAYERGKQDAQAAGDRVAADLRTGAVRFRRLWQECAAESANSRVPGTAADPGEPAGAAAGRADSAGRIIGAAARDAAQIRCLQAIALIDRGMGPGALSEGCPDGRNASRTGR